MTIIKHKVKQIEGEFFFYVEYFDDKNNYTMLMPELVFTEWAKENYAYNVNACTCHESGVFYMDQFILDLDWEDVEPVIHFAKQNYRETLKIETLEL